MQRARRFPGKGRDRRRAGFRRGVVAHHDPGVRRQPDVVVLHLIEPLRRFHADRYIVRPRRFTERVRPGQANAVDEHTPVGRQNRFGGERPREPAVEERHDARDTVHAKLSELGQEPFHVGSGAAHRAHVDHLLCRGQRQDRTRRILHVHHHRRDQVGAGETQRPFHHLGAAQLVVGDVDRSHVERLQEGHHVVRGRYPSLDLVAGRHHVQVVRADLGRDQVAPSTVRPHGGQPGADVGPSHAHHRAPLACDHDAA